MMRITFSCSSIFSWYKYTDPLSIFKLGHLFVCFLSRLFYIQTLLKYMIWKYFFSLCRLSFQLPDSFIWSIKVLKFLRKSDLIFFFFCCLQFWCCIWKSLPNSMPWRFTPVLSSRSFQVLALIVRSVIHF